MNFLAYYVWAVLQAFSTSGTDSVPTYPQTYFRPPLDIPLALSGNFGEPRGTHFHTGLDFKTNGQEGLKVFAAADGYVTRINVSSSGYGNALYVRHPNGWVTVYGHLKQFAPQIMERLRKEQYAKKSFSVDFSLPASELQVRKGEVIAWSGNTGSSGGPHLHFEIRDIYDNVYNPQLFGIPLRDDVQPEVASLELYAMDTLKDRSTHYRVRLIRKAGSYRPQEPLLPCNASRVGFSVNTLDRMNGSTNSLGIYNMTVFDNDRMIYEYQQDKLSFTVTRDVLSHIDYALMKNESKPYFHKCFVDPGNDAPLYTNLVNRGVVDLSDGQPHYILIEIHDFAGNTSLVQFNLRMNSAVHTFATTDFHYTTRLDYDHPNDFTAPGIRLHFPLGSLFDQVYLQYHMDSAQPAKALSPVYQVGSSEVPLRSSFSIGVQAQALPAGWQPKALLVGWSNKGNLIYAGGEWENGWVVSKVREFGSYYVTLDTIPPQIVPLNISPAKNRHGQAEIRLRISDDLSGIARFDTYIDGQWTVTDYDAKTGNLHHLLTSNLPVGPHVFKVVIFDQKQNQAEYNVKFNW